MTIELAEMEHPVAPLEHPETKSRAISRWWLLLGVFAIWVLGWILLQGTNTLYLPTATLTGFQESLNDVRNSVVEAKFNDSPLFLPFEWISATFNWLYDFLVDIFLDASFGRSVPVIGWLGLVAISAWVALALAGVRIALLVGAVLVACGLLGYWEESIETLIISGISVAVCVLIGVPLAIWIAQSKRASNVVTPVLDVMQTMPSFAYLAPLALLFGIGAAGAVVVTFIFALPPLVRIAAHGIRTVSPTTLEATTALGSTPRQLLTRVKLPLARRTILVGLNQTTMAALSMATIAALINGPGLGEPVLSGLQNNDVGRAFVPGICIVIIAIMLDRTTTAAGERLEVSTQRGWSQRTRRIVLAVAGLAALVATYLSRTYLRFAEFPEEPDLGDPAKRWITSASDWFVDVFEGFTTQLKDTVSNGFLNPLQDLMTESPWWLTAGVIASIAFLLGGRKALAATGICIAIILGTGLWYDSMVTLAMTLVAAVVTMVIGISVGVWMGRSRRVDAGLRPFLDMLQTLPGFVYLIPALALFGPGRFLAIVAAIVYAAPVAIKISADGIRGVSPTTIEAAEAAGTNRWQMIGRVQLPMSRGAIVLAANQGLLFVLAMVVIGGLVGGGGLGYLVVAGLSQVELFGKGLAAGIAITALGVLLDRVTSYSAARYGRAEAA